MVLTMVMAVHLPCHCGWTVVYSASNSHQKQERNRTTAKYLSGCFSYHTETDINASTCVHSRYSNTFQIPMSGVCMVAKEGRTRFDVSSRSQAQVPLRQYVAEEGRAEGANGGVLDGGRCGRRRARCQWPGAERVEGRPVATTQLIFMFSESCRHVVSLPFMTRTLRRAACLWGIAL
jgi:hypothetical protein